MTTNTISAEEAGRIVDGLRDLVAAPDGWVNGELLLCAADMILALIPSAQGGEAEPVAWRYRWDRWPEGVWSVAPSDSKQEWIGVLGLTAQPLYAAPPAPVVGEK